MRWPDVAQPERMQRVAVVADEEILRDVLAEAGRAGQVELDATRDSPESEPEGAAPLDRVAGRMDRSGPVAATTGWCPVRMVPELADLLARRGGALVRLPARPGAEPPTWIDAGGPTAGFQPLVDTYGTVPYADVNPVAVAGLAYAVMFGIMFGDAGRGVILVGLGMLLRRGRPARLARWSHLAPFVVGCGLASVACGLLYGEAFGPTGLVPALWIRPLDHPTTLLGAAVAVGAVLLAVSYGLGITNRWRETGPLGALLALSGMAGAALYAGLAAVAGGLLLHVPALVLAGGLVAGGGLTVGFVGSLVAAGGRPAGALEATVEMFDATLRIGANTVSFTRLAAFGMTDAALGQVVWQGTVSAWDRGPALWAAAGILFVAGNAATFALEGLVAGVQALRLEYYEMFSKVFVSEGRTFRPWRLAPGDDDGREATCSPG